VTRGHMSFLLKRGGGVLFAGDAASGGRKGRLRRSPRICKATTEAESASVARLAELTFDAAVFGQGFAPRLSLDRQRTKRRAISRRSQLALRSVGQP
jgi:glyoxylase-like metal-dependent hydrolase (beta-lactamase superfamily II)